MINLIKTKYKSIGQTPSSIYTVFDTDNDIVSDSKEIVTGGIWSNNTASLSTHWSSSVQTNTQRQYYVDVLNTNPSSTDSLVQYTVAYGHRFGSGSNSVGSLNDSPSRAIYSQFRQILTEPGTNQFATYLSGSTDSIYVISFKRNRIKERLDVGNFEIPLRNITARATNASGSVTLGTTVHTLIDDSSITTNTTVNAGREYNLVSGSITTGVFTPNAPKYYGKVYPDHGIIVLDGNVLDLKLGFATNLNSSVEANNHFAVFRSISGSGVLTNPATSDLFGFFARNSETVTSTHYFVRVKNSQYNYSNNNTYVTSSTALGVNAIAEETWRGADSNPITYITTIGLYDNANTLLAVAKVSKPILKSFNNEALIRVKLDF